jgi:hypothetical protein
MDSGPSNTSFDFSQMLQALGQYVTNVQGYLQTLEQQGATGGSVNIGLMMSLQFQMQIMSQFIEAVSNTLSAVHNEMMTCARATKGQ